LAVTVHALARGLRLGRRRALALWIEGALALDLDEADRPLPFGLDFDGKTCDGIGTGAVPLDFGLDLDFRTNRGIGTGAVH